MGERNNKLKDQKSLDQKRVRQAKKPTKRNLATGQKDHFKTIAYGWTKFTHIKIKHTNSKQEQMQKEISYVNFIQLDGP